MWGFAIGASAGIGSGFLLAGSLDHASLAALVCLFLLGVWWNERDADQIEEAAQ